VAEIRTTDRTGLLSVLTAVFERAGVDIAWAKVTTLGSSVVDAFGIVLPAGGDASRETLERELFAVLPAPPAKKVQEAS
jgi:[protein-PII] uridylyltransferase